MRLAVGLAVALTVVAGPALAQEMSIDFGGGAGALCTVRRMDDDRAALLDHVMAHAGMVSIEAADPATAEEDGAMPWSVWTTGDGRDGRTLRGKR